MDRFPSELSNPSINHLSPDEIQKSRLVLDRFLTEETNTPLSEYNLAFQLQGVSKAVSNVVEGLLAPRLVSRHKTTQEASPKALRLDINGEHPDDPPLSLKVTQETAQLGALLELTSPAYSSAKNRKGTVMRSRLPTRLNIEEWLTNDQALLFEDGDTIFSSAVYDDDFVASYPFHVTRSSDEHRMRYLDTTRQLIYLIIREA